MRLFLLVWLQRLVKLMRSFFQVLENWLEGFGFAHRRLVGANFSGDDLRGCDFSRCNLNHANLEKVVGGFSPLRPVILIAAIAFSVWLVTTLPPLPSIATLQVIHLPEQVQTFFYTLLAVCVLLKLLLIALYSVKLPTRVIQQQPVNFWQSLIAGSKASVAILPSYFANGCYLLASATATVHDRTDKLLLLTIAILFGVVAFCFFMWAVGEVFIFRSCFTLANLKGANLANAKLPGCNFKGANLNSTNLQGGDFRNCNFSGADLRLADLRGANLCGAKLRGAKTSGAIGLVEALHDAD